jgi:hypothetical protein
MEEIYCSIGYSVKNARFAEIEQLNRADISAIKGNRSKYVPSAYPMQKDVHIGSDTNTQKHAKKDEN